METKNCPKCGGMLFHNKGVSKSNGKPYENFNCGNKDCDYIEWVDLNKVAAKRLDAVKEDGGFFEKVASLVDEERKLRG